MAGGPLFPYSIHTGATGRIFHNVHATIATIQRKEGMGVEASLGADATLEMWFEMPQVLPTGTGKLRATVISNVVTGNAKYDIEWKSFAALEDINVALNSVALQTLSWGADDDTQLLEDVTTLSGDTIVADEWVKLNVIFRTASWTVAAISTWNFSIIWE